MQRPHHTERSNVMNTSETEPTTPTAFDILCGTGTERSDQHANELFSSVVYQYVGQYSRALSKKEKMQVSKAAYDAVIQSGIRFLKRHPIHQYWYVANNKVGRDKIGHFLRQHRSATLDNDSITTPKRANSSSLAANTTQKSSPSLIGSAATSDVTNERFSALHYRTQLVESGKQGLTNVALQGGCRGDNLISAAFYEHRNIDSIRLDLPETSMVAAKKASSDFSQIASNRHSRGTKPSLSSEYSEMVQRRKAIEFDEFDATHPKCANDDMSRTLATIHSGLGTTVATDDAPNFENCIESPGDIIHANAAINRPSLQNDGSLDKIVLFDDATLSEYLD